MPAGDGHLSIVASQELGDLGSGQGTPTVFRWRWYYGVPSLALWALILLVLILVRGNHSWQAWLILLPPSAVIVSLGMIARLVSMPPDMAEPMTDYLVSLAATWTIVWLLGHWFAGLNRIAGFFLALTMMLALCSLSLYCALGMASVQELAIWLAVYGIGSFTLLLSTTLSGMCCRGQYRPGLFMAWMILWTFLASAISVPIVAMVVAGFEANGIVESLTVFVMALFSCLIFGGILSVALYVMNLPFMLLATRSPFFRERFRQFFRMTEEPLRVPTVRPIVAVGDEL